MHPLTRYYIHQAGGGGGIGPIYTLPLFIQSGHGIGDYLGPLFRMIKPWLFRGAKPGAKALGRAALQTGVTFFPTSLTTLRVIKRSFLNTSGRLYLPRWHVAVAANADVLHTHQTPPR